MVRQIKYVLLMGLVFALFLLGCARPACAQILSNGGFEAGLSNWSARLAVGGAAVFANTTSDIHSGTNACLISVSDAGTSPNSVRLVSSTFTASAADTYVLRFWASASVDFANLGINIIGAMPTAPLIPFEISTNEDNYQEYLFAFKASGQASIAFNFQTAGNYWLDDVEVLDLTNNDGWDIPMTYLWQWGQERYSLTNSVGWGGGDNDKSVLLPDGSVAWIFNDTWTETFNFYSNIHGGGDLPRNSVVHQVGTNLYMLKTSTVFVPTNTNDLYWIGGPVVESNKLLVLVSEVNATAITRVGTSIAQLSLPALTLDSITTVASPASDDYNPVLNGQDGYYYIYWASNNFVRVARTPVGQLAVSSAWNYWTPGAWVTNHSQAVPLPYLQGAWSCAQLGVSNFAMVYMPDLDWNIVAQFAPTPLGPWSAPINVVDTPYQWGELNYMPNICAGTGSNGLYTIGYSDNGSPDGLAKVAADKSYYNPHFVTANLLALSPFSAIAGAGGPGSRISIKFAADQDYGNDLVNVTQPAGVLSSSNWFNFFGPDSASKGATNVPFYSSQGQRYQSSAVLVYDWAGEINLIGNNAPLSNNVALMNSFINVQNNGWYLSVTNLDAPFTNGYSVYFYYQGGEVGRGGQNYLRYYSGKTTNGASTGLERWDLYSTAATNNGVFVQGLTPLSTSAANETPNANYCVFTNLYGGAFSLMITNGNYGGISAIEIVASSPPLSAQFVNGNIVLTWYQGTLQQTSDLTAPWSDVVATSPYSLPATAPQQFFRIAP